MKKFKVEYTHVEETTYTEWIDAPDAETALETAENNPNFTKTERVQGIEMKDFKIVNEKKC